MFLNSQEKKELDLKIKINHSIHPHPKCNQGINEFLYVVYDNFISFIKLNIYNLLCSYWYQDIFFIKTLWIYMILE